MDRALNAVKKPFLKKRESEKKSDTLLSVKRPSMLERIKSSFRSKETMHSSKAEGVGENVEIKSEVKIKVKLTFGARIKKQCVRIKLLFAKSGENKLG